jgi:hypothetical protein
MQLDQEALEDARMAARVSTPVAQLIVTTYLEHLDEPMDEEKVYVIRKSGYWYRPNSSGYTANLAEAGRYTKAEAEAISHPNGEGPRDNMSYWHQDEALLRDSSAAFEEEPQIKREIETDLERARCPSCDAANVFLAHSVRNLDARRHVECRICQMRGPIRCGNAEAVAAWNALPRKTATYEVVGRQHRGRKRGGDANRWSRWRNGDNQTFDTAEGWEIEERLLFAEVLPAR